MDPRRSLRIAARNAATSSSNARVVTATAPRARAAASKRARVVTATAPRARVAASKGTRTTKATGRIRDARKEREYSMVSRNWENYLASHAEFARASAVLQGKMKAVFKQAVVEYYDALEKDKDVKSEKHQRLHAAAFKALELAQ